MRRSISGFSLIEVLVALVILTIGLIGIFNLHIVAKRGSYESFQQTQAAFLASDIINRMKLNRSELANYAGSFSGNLSQPAVSCDVAVGANVVCGTIETRLWDLFQWETLFRGATETVGGADVGALDDATGCIQVQANGEVTVVLSWQGMRELKDGASASSSFVKSCGTASDRRRVYSLTTVII